MTGRLSRALYRGTINVIVIESTDGEDKRKHVEGVPPDHIAETVIGCGETLFDSIIPIVQPTV